MEYGNSKNGYGKRSVWYWVGIYIIVAIVVYGAIYLVYKKVHNSNSGSGTTQSTSIY